MNSNSLSSTIPTGAFQHYHFLIVLFTYHLSVPTFNSCTSHSHQQAYIMHLTYFLTHTFPTHIELGKLSSLTFGFSLRSNSLHGVVPTGVWDSAHSLSRSHSNI